MSLRRRHPVLSFSVNCRPQDEGDNANNLCFIALSENPSGCGVKLSQKRKAQEENGLGTIGVRHDRCHATSKCYFVTWWAILSLHQSLTRNPLDPGGFVALYLFLGIRFKFLFPWPGAKCRKKPK